MTLTIERVTTKKQLREFIGVPWQVYADDPNWVPWLYFERLEFFDKRKNAFFEHAEADYFIARRNGEAVGTIAAILNHRHNEFQEENVAHFGVFELMNDPEAAAALLATASEWAQKRGTNKIVGPVNLCTNDECGMLIDGFDSPPVILMTYNPRYYLDFMEPAGFQKAMDLYAWDVDLTPFRNPDNLPQKLIRVIDKVRERHNLSIRTINLDDWDNEVARLKEIYNSAWEKNWGFVPMTDKEIDHLVDGLKPIMDPNIIVIVEKGDRPVGFGLGAPDVNVVLNQIRPGASTIGAYIGAARMLRRKKQTHRFRAIALGVLEEYRALGVGAMMYYELIRRGLASGYTHVEGSWVLETNDAMNQAVQLLGGQLYKRYRIYEKEL